MAMIEIPFCHKITDILIVPKQNNFAIVFVY